MSTEILGMSIFFADVMHTAPDLVRNLVEADDRVNHRSKSGKTALDISKLFMR